MFNLSYLFCVFFLVLIVIFLIILYMRSFFFLKYLIILVYIRGVVVFILYISCICWNIHSKFNLIFLFFSLFLIVVYDQGIYLKFSDIGENFWMYIYFSILFSFLVTIYSLNLFKSTGSLRF